MPNFDNCQTSIDKELQTITIVSLIKFLQKQIENGIDETTPVFINSTPENKYSIENLKAIEDAFINNIDYYERLVLLPSKKIYDNEICYNHPGF